MKQVYLAHWNELLCIAKDLDMSWDEMYDVIVTSGIFGQDFGVFEICMDEVDGYEEEYPEMVKLFKAFYKMYGLGHDTIVHWEYCK